MALPAGRKGIKASLVKSDGTLIEGGGGGGGGSSIVPVDFTAGSNVEVVGNGSVLIGNTVHVSLLLKATSKIEQYAELGYFAKKAVCTSLIRMNKDAVSNMPDYNNAIVEKPNSSYPEGRLYTAGTLSDNQVMYIYGSYMIEEE